MSSILFGDTVTLFNHYRDTWYKTVLSGVQWLNKVTKTSDSDGKLTVIPEVEITIPYRNGYILPKEYIGEGFTFNPKGLDIVVLGEVSEEITGDFTITSLKKKYDNVATIYAVQDNTLRPQLKHWSVNAK